MYMLSNRTGMLMHVCMHSGTPLIWPPDTAVFTITSLRSGLHHHTVGQFLIANCEYFLRSQLIDSQT